MTRSSTLSWPPADSDRGSGERDDLVQLGVWMFLATVVMLFAAFTSAYIVRRSASDWVPIRLPAILWANTAMLAASSIALERARRGSRMGNTTSAAYGVSTAAGLGLLFLAGQVTAWRELATGGVYLPTSPHGSFFFVLTGAHAIHVSAGLALLTYAATRILHARARPDRTASARLVAATATFWHFLAALWLYVFALVTLF